VGDWKLEIGVHKRDLPGIPNRRRT